MSNPGNLLKTGLLDSIRSGGWAEENSLAAIENLSFPSRKQEEWKYSLPPFAAESYKISTENPASAAVPGNLPDGIHLIFSEGRWLPEAGTKQLPEGLEITASRKPASVKPYEDNIFSRLNEATAAAFGIHIRIAKNARIEQPVLLIHLSANSADAQWIQPTICVEAEEGSSAGFAEIHQGNNTSVMNIVNEIRIGKDAQLNWFHFQNTGGKSILVNQTRAALETNAQFRHLVVSQSAGFVRNNLDIHIHGKGAHADLFGLSLGIEKSHCDHHSFVHHAEENSSSRQLYKGIYSGKSTGVFNGKILVDQIAQKTNAYQSGRNILLSPDARVFAKPQLEIFADDVKCSHGATIGQLEEEPLFYLRSRGLDLATARLLLVRAFASEILMELGDESLREFAENLAIARLDEMTRSL
jgi:Fe-S cluster assembly protein SufD